MSNQANIELLETIFEEVQEAFPYLDEEKQIEIANNRFWDIAQWTSKTKSGALIKNGPITFMYTSQRLKSKSLFWDPNRLPL